MDPAAAASRKSSPSDRFISIFTPPNGSTTSSVTADVELTEDDVFAAGDLPDSIHHRSDSASTSSSSSPSPKQKNPRLLNRSGILVALTESEKTNSRSVFKSSVSPVTSSSGRMMIPKPVPMERTSSSSAAAYSVSFKYHQSAPVRVPMMMRRSEKSRVRDGGFVYVDDEEMEGEEGEEGEDDEEMVPPHEIVARKEAKTPVISCSVLEGAGRTLKGRDLRQVRNAVFRRTGFID